MYGKGFSCQIIVPYCLISNPKKLNFLKIVFRFFVFFQSEEIDSRNISSLSPAAALRFEKNSFHLTVRFTRLKIFQGGGPMLFGRNLKAVQNFGFYCIFINKVSKFCLGVLCHPLTPFCASMNLFKKPLDDNKTFEHNLKVT